MEIDHHHAPEESTDRMMSPLTRDGNPLDVAARVVPLDAVVHGMEGLFAGG